MEIMFVQRWWKENFRLSTHTFRDIACVAGPDLANFFAMKRNIVENVTN